MEVLMCKRVNDPRHSLFHLLNRLIRTASELRGLPKVTGRKFWTIGRVTNYLDAHLGQIVCDKDGVVDCCIVLVKIPLTQFKECWPLPTESLPEFPLANQLWCIDFPIPPSPLSCDNQGLVGCIPIFDVAVHLNLKS